MAVPIVMAAFGTTRRAMETYAYLDACLGKYFSEHEIHWAYTSRMVADRLRHGQGIHRPHPGEVIQKLADAGHRWAVVQSLHLTCGHEFYRLVAEVQHPLLRVSIGLPLLCDQQDYRAVADGLAPLVTDRADEAVVLVGHGTDHPAWTSYTALHYLLQQRFGPKVHVGGVEWGCPDRESIVAAVTQGGYTKARLAPFMLVAGAHFEEDLAGDGDSWKNAFESAGIRTRLDNQGLGRYPPVIELFRRHITAALDAIPKTEWHKNTFAFGTRQS